MPPISSVASWLFSLRFDFVSFFFSSVAPANWSLAEENRGPNGFFGLFYFCFVLFCIFFLFFVDCRGGKWLGKENSTFSSNRVVLRPQRRYLPFAVDGHRRPYLRRWLLFFSLSLSVCVCVCVCVCVPFSSFDSHWLADVNRHAKNRSLTTPTSDEPRNLSIAAGMFFFFFIIIIIIFFFFFFFVVFFFTPISSRPSPGRTEGGEFFFLIQFSFFFLFQIDFRVRRRHPRRRRQFASASGSEPIDWLQPHPPIRSLQLDPKLGKREINNSVNPGSVHTAQDLHRNEPMRYSFHLKAQQKRYLDLTILNWSLLLIPLACSRVQRNKSSASFDSIEMMWSGFPLILICKLKWSNKFHYDPANRTSFSRSKLNMESTFKKNLLQNLKKK